MRDVAASAVDTNVLVAANGWDLEISPECTGASVDALLMIIRGHRKLLLDNGSEIFDEYRRHASLAGQPGTGDAFLKWVHDHRYRHDRCRLVTLTPEPSRGYVEFPADTALAGFDPSDRKFAAVVASTDEAASVLNATDSDWWKFRMELEQNGIQVDFVCDDVVAKWRQQDI